MIRHSLRLRQRLWFLRFQVPLALIGSLFMLGRIGEQAPETAWQPVLYCALSAWGMWAMIGILVGSGLAVGYRSSAFTQTLPISARDLWLTSIFTAWIEIVLPALVTVCVAVLLTPSLLAGAPAFLVNFALAAAGFVLLCQSRDLHLAQVRNDWVAKLLFLSGLGLIVLTTQLQSPLFSALLASSTLVLGLRTWRHLPASFSLVRSAPPTRSRARRWLSARTSGPGWLKADTRLLIALHPTWRMVLVCIYVPFFGLLFPWGGDKPMFLFVTSGTLALPFLTGLPNWKRVAYLPIAPRRYFILHTLPVLALFAVSFGLGTLLYTQIGEGDSAPEARDGRRVALQLLLVALLHYLALRISTASIRNKRVPEGRYTLLGGTPFQLARNLLTIAGVGFLGWNLIMRQEQTNAQFQSWFAQLLDLFPFGPLAAWALLGISSLGLWVQLEARFRRWDPSTGIRV